MIPWRVIGHSPIKVMRLDLPFFLKWDQKATAHQGRLWVGWVCTVNVSSKLSLILMKTYLLIKPLRRTCHNNNHNYSILVGNSMRTSFASLCISIPATAAEDDSVIQAWGNWQKTSLRARGLCTPTPLRLAPAELQLFEASLLKASLLNI